MLRELLTNYFGPILGKIFKDMVIDAYHVYQPSLEQCLMDHIFLFMFLFLPRKILVWTLSLVYLERGGALIPSLW